MSERRVINNGHVFLEPLVIKLKATTEAQPVSSKRKQLQQKNVYKPNLRMKKKEEIKCYIISFPVGLVGIRFISFLLRDLRLRKKYSSSSTPAPSPRRTSYLIPLRSVTFCNPSAHHCRITIFKIYFLWFESLNHLHEHALWTYMYYIHIGISFKISLWIQHPICIRNYSGAVDKCL